MKNIIFSVVTLLLIALCIIAISRGITIGSVKILSVGQIKEQSTAVKSKQTETNNLNTSKYNSALSELEEAKKKLETSRQEYYDIASTSTDEEIEKANVLQTYSMEYLWERVGSHATDSGVNLQMDILPSDTQDRSVLSFEVSGTYIAIRNFVYALEDDKNLAFRIENFKLIDFKIDPKDKNEEYQENLIKATFNVDNINIKEENTTTKLEDIFPKEEKAENVENIVNTINGESGNQPSE